MTDTYSLVVYNFLFYKEGLKTYALYAQQVLADMQPHPMWLSSTHTGPLWTWPSRQCPSSPPDRFRSLSTGQSAPYTPTHHLQTQTTVKVRCRKSLLKGSNLLSKRSGKHSTAHAEHTNNPLNWKTDANDICFMHFKSDTFLSVGIFKMRSKWIHSLQEESWRFWAPARCFRTNTLIKKTTQRSRWKVQTTSAFQRLACIFCNSASSIDGFHSLCWHFEAAHTWILAIK